MSSEHSPTSPRDNPLCIPTICLDSLNDSPASSEQFCPLSETEADQYFSVNVSNFLSWLSYFGAQKRFLVAALLTANCEPGFRRALHLLNLYDKDVDGSDYKDDLWFKANDFDYLSTLKSAGLPPATLTQQLLELVSHFSIPSMVNSSCFSSRRISTASALDQTRDTDLLNIPKVSTVCDSQLRLSYSSEKTQSLKKLYLNLIAESLNQGCDIFTLNHCENPYNLSDCALKELVMQLPLSQLLIKVFLHPAFTRDDRNWLCSLLRTQQQVMNLESVAVKDDTSSGFSNNALFSKSFDCLLEALSDLALILQSTSSTTYTSSLSHSLTSSGFLSGCGGSGSQCDLLSETTNGHSGYSHTNGGSQYGTLLTVPTPDPRASNHNFIFSGYPGLPGTLEHRRLSDGPYILSQSLATSGIGNDARSLPPHMEHKHVLVSRTACSSTDCVLNATSDVKSLSIARASLPNALTAQYPVETITERASDSVSLSSASSTFSSNLDLRPPCLHRFGGSPSKSAGAVSTGVSNNDDNYSLPPSPPSTVAAGPAGSRLTAVSGTRTSPVPHICPSRIPCSLACANYSLPEHGFHGPCLFESTQCNNSHGHCLHPCDHRPDSNIFTYHDSSPEPQSVKKALDFPEERTTFFDPTSPMSAVPGWLKRLRLHKYANLFQSLSYEEFIGITESWLEERNVTQGARTKLLLNIRKLSTRGPLLQQVEANLLHAPSTGPATLTALRNCLTEIWTILHTPMKPCLSSSPLTAKIGQSNLSANNSNSCLQDHPHQSVPLHLTPTTENISHDQVIDSEPLPGLIGQSATTHTQHTEFDENTAFGGRKTGQTSEVECLPSLIMSCLTKVCSRLLVSSQPDVDCCEKFVQLLDIISEHQAFSDKQKSLTASWRQQMFNLLDTLPFHLTSDPSRSSRSIPRSYHGNKPFRKPYFTAVGRLHSGSKKSLVPCCSASQPDEAFTTISTAHSDTPCATSHTHQIDAVSMPHTPCISVHPTHNYAVSGRAHHSIYSVDDNIHRRHSVPVNQTRNGPQPIKSCQGRRMPSPNPAFMPSRNTQFFFPGGQPQPSSSEMDISHSTIQFPGTRFPSPVSGFDRGCAVGPHRSLIPPATAPPTRMPSPSDVRHHGSGISPLTNARSSMLLTVPVGHGPTNLMCPCASGSLAPGTRMEDSVRTNSTSTARPPGPASNFAFQTGYRPDLQQHQHHPMFSRPAIPSDSLAPLDCATFQSGVTDLHQACSSLQAPDNMYFNSVGSLNLVPNSGSVVKYRFDTVPQVVHAPGPSQPRGPSMADFGSCGTGTHEHGSDSTLNSAPNSSLAAQSGANTLGYNYHHMQSQQPNCPCIMTQWNNYEPNSVHAAARGADQDWSSDVTQLAFSSIYAPARNPTVQTADDAISNSDAGTDFIEHDLDLLTRKVTELAIGEFDSPVE